MKLLTLLIFFLFSNFTNRPLKEEWKITKAEYITIDPPFAQCHASTLVELSSGDVMAAWFAGSAEGKRDVCIWTSTKRNGSWSTPTIIATGIVDDSLRYPCWNPVLFRCRSNKLFLFYKVGPSPQTWWGMMKTSDNEGKTWSSASRLPDEILGPIKNKPIQLPGGVILCPSSTETAKKWSAHIEMSVDTGRTWKKIAIDTTGFDIIQPSILIHGKGRLQLLCRSKQGAVVQCWSHNSGKSWGKLSKTNLLNPNSGIDAVTLRSGEHLLVYNPDLPGKEWQNGRSRLRVASSRDGLTWKDIAILENGDKEEFSYPAVIEGKDGTVHITYTYDRKNIRYVMLKRVKGRS